MSFKMAAAHAKNEIGAKEATILLIVMYKLLCTTVYFCILLYTTVIMYTHSIDRRRQWCTASIGFILARSDDTPSRWVHCTKYS